MSHSGRGRKPIIMQKKDKFNNYLRRNKGKKRQRGRTVVTYQQEGPDIWDLV